MAVVLLVASLVAWASASLHPNGNPASLGFVGLPWDDYQQYNKMDVQGAVPTWLNGSVYRNGPAKYPQHPFNSTHWFMGLAMVHAFHFADGEVSYVNQFVKSSVYKTAMATAWEEVNGGAKRLHRRLNIL